MKNINSNLFLYSLIVIASLMASWLIVKLASIGLLMVIGLILAILLGWKIVLNPQVGLWLILFFLPFERIPSIEIGGISLRLNLFFGGITVISFAIAYLIGKIKTAPNPLAIFMWLFIFNALLSTAFAFDAKRALIVTIFIGFTMVIAMIVINLLQTEKNLNRAKMIIWSSAAAASIFGLYQFLGDVIGLPVTLTGLDLGYTKEVLGFPRIQAFSYEPLYFGNYLLLPVSLLIADLLIDQAARKKISRWLFLILLLVNLILTVSRGAYLAFIAILIFMIITLPQKIINPKLVLLVFISLIVISIGSAMFLGLGPEQALEKFTKHAQIADFGQSESTQSRLDEFERSLEAWRSRPLFGIGLGNYGAFALNYPDPGEVRHYPIVNNQYLETLAETGIIGFSLILLITITLLYRSIIAFKLASDLPIKAMLVGVTAAFIGLLIQYNFFSTLYIIHVWVLIGLLVATQNNILARSKLRTNDLIDG